MPCDLSHESALAAAGDQTICGIDEAGRGPLAGPVTVAAVILPAGFSHPILNDSKKLTAARREKIFVELTTDPLVIWHCVVMDEKEVDRLNILGATHEGMRRAAMALVPQPDAALIDGLPVRDFPVFQQALVGGDGRSLSIAAASVIAKVTRDQIMLAQDALFPHYGFAKHKGYGTKEHLRALFHHGPCPIHRRSFAPVAQAVLPLE